MYHINPPTFFSINIPGFGFAKTTAQNFEVLNQLEVLQILELPYNAPMTATRQKRLTEREYLELEERAETRHEFVDGAILAMAGA